MSRPLARGQSMIEYVLALLLVSIIVIAILMNMGVTVTGFFEGANSGLNGDGAPPSSEPTPEPDPAFELAWERTVHPDGAEDVWPMPATGLRSGQAALVVWHEDTDATYLHVLDSDGNVALDANLGTFRTDAADNTPDGGVVVGEGTGSSPEMRKYDTAGNLVWTYDQTGNGNTMAMLATGDAVYAAGQTVGDTVFEGTPATLSDRAPWIVKTDANGNHEWSAVFPTESQANLIFALAVSPDGNTVYAAGNVGNATTFAGETAPELSAFLLALDADTGAKQWVSFYEDGGASTFRDVSVAPDGSVYVVGHQSDTFDLFGMLILRKYNTAGDEMWTQVKARSGGDAAVAVSSDGNIYVAGETTTGVDDAALIGQQDVFAASYDAAGLPVLDAFMAGTADGWEDLEDMYVDGSTVYLVGSAEVASFNGQPGSTHNFGFIVKLLGE